jgi:hypothetical protein
MKNLIFARLLLADLLLSALLFAQTTAPATQNQSAASSSSQSQPAAPTATLSTPVLPQRYRQNRVAARARQYYTFAWGVDSLSVKSAESGEIIRFSYRVLDADKAKMLNDKKAEPSLIDPGAGVKLVVPSLEKIGKLRQSSAPEPGKMYWMAFSNKGGFVKPGHRVDVVIGPFRAQGLIVQ